MDTYPAEHINLTVAFVYTPRKVFVTDEDLRGWSILLLGSIATCKLNISLVLCIP